MTQDEKLEALVKNLADGYNWNWTRVLSQRDAADAVLRLMGELGLLEARVHPLTWGGPSVWIINGRAYGRTDGIEV